VDIRTLYGNNTFHGMVMIAVVHGISSVGSISEVCHYSSTGPNGRHGPNIEDPVCLTEAIILHVCKRMIAFTSNEESQPLR